MIKYTYSYIHAQNIFECLTILEKAFETLLPPNYSRFNFFIFFIFIFDESLKLNNWPNANTGLGQIRAGP